MQNADVKTVYGEAVEAGGKTVIPVASVAYGFGGGSGMKPTVGVGEEGLVGTGAGGGIMANPIGFIEVSDGETRFVPINDVKRLLGAFMLGISVGMLIANRRR